MNCDRRDFLKIAGVGAATAQRAAGAPGRRLKIGYTSITWGFRPEFAEPGIRDCAKLGYHAYESLGETLEAWEAKGGLGRLLEEYKMPLPSTYFNVNLHDPARRRQQVENVIRWGGYLKKYGGKVAVLGPAGVNRATWDFKAAQADVFAALNEIGAALDDIGLVGALHQHTNTSVMTREEVYATMDAVSRKVGFGPDVAQLAAGGADPVAVLKDFLPLLRAVHVKDYLGGPEWSGYCPLGQGKVDLPAVMDLLEKAPRLTYAMVELDPGRNPPVPAFEAARISKEYLKKLGYQFRA